MSGIIWLLVASACATTATSNSTMYGIVPVNSTDSSAASMTTIPIASTISFAETHNYTASSTAYNASTGSAIGCWSAGSSNCSWAWTMPPSDGTSSMILASESGQTTISGITYPVETSMSSVPANGSYEGMMPASPMITLTMSPRFGNNFSSPSTSSIDPTESRNIESRSTLIPSPSLTDDEPSSTSTGPRTRTAPTITATPMPEIPSLGNRRVSGEGKKRMACWIALMVVALSELGSLMRPLN